MYRFGPLVSPRLLASTQQVRSEFFKFGVADIQQSRKASVDTGKTEPADAFRAGMAHSYCRHQSFLVSSQLRMLWMSSALHSTGSQCPPGRLVTVRSAQAARIGSPRRLPFIVLI